MRKMDGSRMINWVKSWFKNTKSPQYTVFCRGRPVHHAQTLEEAEQFLHDIFNETDSKRKGGRGFGSHQGSSRNQRWKGFRNQCKISKTQLTSNQL